MTSISNMRAPRALPLSVEGISVRAGTTTILRDLRFALRPGELCALIGPSGAGKSTLIKVLLGLRSPSAGTVRLGSEALAESGVPVGYVPQQDALHTTLSVRGALDFSAQLRLPGLSETDRASRVEAVCAQVGLSERMDLKIARLSGGQKKRVSVAMELLTSPPVLILDEPTSGLDPGLEARMMALFSALAQEGRIVLVATHAMESLSRCDALMVLVAGNLAFMSHPEEALVFFRVDRFAALFDQLGKQAPEAWANTWQRSELRGRFERRPARAIRPPKAASSEVAVQEIAPPREATSQAQGPVPPSAPAAPAAPTPASPSAAERLAALKAARARGEGGS